MAYRLVLWLTKHLASQYLITLIHQKTYAQRYLLILLSRTSGFSALSTNPSASVSKPSKRGAVVSPPVSFSTKSNYGHTCQGWLTFKVLDSCISMLPCHYYIHNNKFRLHFQGLRLTLLCGRGRKYFPSFICEMWPKSWYSLLIIYPDDLYS